jgi:hypothetical protein
MGKDRLGCANHHARNICSKNRTILRHRLQAKIFAGLKQRLLALDLVAQFLKTYVQEVNANHERGARLGKLQTEQARLTRQIRGNYGYDQGYWRQPEPGRGSARAGTPARSHRV